MELKIKNLVIGYQQPVLKNINLTAQSGELIVLIGKNGSGKSTLLKTLSGILPALSGQLQLDDINIWQLSPKERAKYISIVLTDRIDLPLSVIEFISLGRQAYTGMLDQLSNTDLAIINQIMNDLDLMKLINRSLLELSDGERQKVLIARALVQKTPVLLLDEPTTHLDIENKAVLIQKLLKISKEQQKIVIMSTHDINLMLPKTDKIWLAGKSGSILEKDNKQPVLEELFTSNLIEYDQDCQVFRLT